MATREYTFVVGPETSTQPSVGTPSASSDLLSLGYADDRYLQGGQAVADIAAIKAIGSSDRFNGDIIVETTNYLAYIFRSGSSATADDDIVLQPDSGTGRWHRSAPTALTVATSISSGTITSYVPVVADNTHAPGDAAYTVLDADGYDVINFTTTLTAGRTVTLPTAADNDGRTITIKKSDSSSFAVTVDGEGAETIDGITTAVLSNQYDFVTLRCDGTSWYIIARNFGWTNASGNTGNTTSPSYDLDFIDSGSGVTYTGRIGSTNSSGANNGYWMVNSGGTGKAQLQFGYESGGAKAGLGTSGSGQSLLFYIDSDLTNYIARLEESTLEFQIANGVEIGTGTNTTSNAHGFGGLTAIPMLISESCTINWSGNVGVFVHLTDSFNLGTALVHVDYTGTSVTIISSVGSRFVSGAPTSSNEIGLTSTGSTTNLILTKHSSGGTANVIVNSLGCGVPTVTEPA